MDEHKLILINLQIEKSEDAVSTAELLFSNKKFRGALNRIYYAVFYIVTALAIKHSFPTSKHTSLIGWFNKKFIHTDKVFDSKYAGFFKNLFDLRQENDYSFESELPSTDEIDKYLFDAKEFIKVVRNEIVKDI